MSRLEAQPDKWPRPRQDLASIKTAGIFALAFNVKWSLVSPSGLTEHASDDEADLMQSGVRPEILAPLMNLAAQRERRGSTSFLSPARSGKRPPADRRGTIGLGE